MVNMHAPLPFRRSNGRRGFKQSARGEVRWVPTRPPDRPQRCERSTYIGDSLPATGLSLAAGHLYDERRLGKGTLMATGKSGTPTKSEETKRGARKPRSSAYYARIGRIGGEAVREKIGPGGFREMGLLGGAATKQRYGSEYYAEIGRKGGLRRGVTTREKYGSEYYANIGRKGGLRGSKKRREKEA
jgi:general stress protein YciG